MVWICLKRLNKELGNIRDYHENDISSGLNTNIVVHMSWPVTKRIILVNLVSDMFLFDYYMKTPPPSAEFPILDI